MKAGSALMSNFDFVTNPFVYDAMFYQKTQWAFTWSVVLETPWFAVRW